MTAVADTSTPPFLPARDRAGHKGTFGTVLVVGGCAAGGAVMLGAPVLAARAALRAGAGLVKLLLPEPLVVPALQMLPSATAVALPVDDAGRVIPHEAAERLDAALERAQAAVVGPGLGPMETAGPASESVTLRLLGQTEVPVIADADALNALAGLADFAGDLRAPIIMTPHPGEFDRLAAALRVGLPRGTPEQRAAAASGLAQRLGVVCVLKGAGTVVSDGLRAWSCERGHPCLATAGTGDVLAGLLGGLAAQFVAAGPRASGSVKLPSPPGRPLDLYDAARVGVLAHAVAGERWAERHGGAGLLADELADLLPGALRG